MENKTNLEIRKIGRIDRKRYEHYKKDDKKYSKIQTTIVMWKKKANKINEATVHEGLMKWIGAKKTDVRLNRTGWDWRVS